MKEVRILALSIKIQNQITQTLYLIRRKKVFKKFLGIKIARDIQTKTEIIGNLFQMGIKEHMTPIGMYSIQTVITLPNIHNSP